jgi:8-amino-7-oxononanoate synthase
MTATEPAGPKRLDEILVGELAALDDQGLRRHLREVAGVPGPTASIDGRDCLMLAGSNYLDLAGDPRVTAAAARATAEHGTAAMGSRLICGNRDIHDDFEAELARFAGFPAALVFSTGYMANLGVLTALAGEDDVIISDELNHASIIDACRLSRAETRVFRHNDPDDLARLGATLTGFRRRLLVIDGVYSMDGDTAPLTQLVPVARHHDMVVVVDDAHGFGILGTNGRGTTEADNVTADVLIGNLGKALGSFGAFVACSTTLRDYLINTSRAFIFTCAPPGPVIAAAREALRIIAEEPQRARTLLDRAEQLREGLRAAGHATAASTTHIVPLILGDNETTMSTCAALLDTGIYAQGIRYPTVPAGTARLRLTPTSAHSTHDMDRAIAAISAALAR